MITETESLQLQLQTSDEHYSVDAFNNNFKKLDSFAKTINKSVSEVVDASKTFDVWTETKGVTYVSDTKGTDLVTITETLTLSDNRIAVRTSEELQTGWRVTTVLYLQGGEVSKVQTWTEQPTGWMGVVS